LLEYTTASDGNTVNPNQLVPENEHDKQLDDVALTPNEVHPKGYKTLKHPDGQEVSNIDLRDNRQAYFNEYDDVATKHLVGDHHNEQSIVKLPKCQNDYSQIVIADNKRNSEDVTDKLLGANVTTIYLAGYDDQIFNLMYDIKKQGLGYELLVYFYIFTHNKYRNIGYLYTNKKILHDNILKYTHYFCLNYSNSGNSCLESLGLFNSEVTIVPEFNEQSLINVDSKGSIVSDKVNTESEYNSFNTIHSTISDPEEHYPVKQISGSYEFLLPKQNDINLKDIYIDLLKPKHQHSNENEVREDTNDINNAKRAVEALNANDVTKSDPKLYQQGLDYLEAIPSETLNIDTTAKKQVDAHILIDPLHVDKDFTNNDGNYVFVEIPDQNTNQEYNVVSDLSDINLSESNKTDSVLQLIPCEGQEHMHVINASNNHNSQSEITLSGNEGNMEFQNMILPELPVILDTVPNDNLLEISDKVTECRNTFENSIILNEANQAKDDKNVNGGNINLVPSNEVTEINLNLENTNALNATNKNIILNNVLNNGAMTPQINEIEIVENTVGVETNVIDDQVPNDKKNNIITEKTPHGHSINDVTLFTPSKLLAQPPGSSKSILIPHENIHQIIPDLNPFVKLEKAPMNYKEPELDRYFKFINPNIITNTLPLIAQISDLNTIPKANLKSEFSCNNVDNSVITDCYNFSTIGMDIKKVPQSQMHHYHYGFDDFSKPCNHINERILNNKQHYHALPSSYSQYSNIPNRNQQKLEYEDQKHNFNVPCNWPCNILKTPGGIDPLKNQYTRNVFTSFSNNKNIIKYVEPDASRKSENILDLPKSNQNNIYFHNALEEISQIKDMNFLNAIQGQNKTDQSQIVTNMPGKDSIVKYIHPDKYNAIVYPTVPVSYAYFSDKLYQPIDETKYSNTYYMPDSCAYKNLLSLDGQVKPTINTPPISIISTGDTTLVNNNVPRDHKHIDGELFPIYNSHLIQAKIPITCTLSMPKSQNYNTYLSNLGEIKGKMFPFTSTLTPFASEKYISNEGLYKNLLTIRPEFVYDSKYQVINNIPGRKGHLILPIKIENVTAYNVSETKNRNEPIIKYVQYIPPRQTTVLPPNFNSLPSLYYLSLFNNNPSTKNRCNSFLSNFRSPLYQRSYAQHGKLSDLTVSEKNSKIERLTEDLHETEFPYNDNYNVGNSNPILLQTMYKPLYAKVLYPLPISTVPIM
ncbi:jg4906, partial [Pararge aegeria aegeria]